MTETVIDVFNQFGKLAIPSDVDLAALTPERRQRFETLRAAAQEAETAEAAVKSATAALTSGVAALGEAQTKLNTIRPKLTFHQLWQQSVASQRQ